MSDGCSPVTRKIAVILIGASAFPGYHKSGEALDNPSFKRSAEAFRDLMESGAVLNAGQPIVLDLFDSDLHVSEITKRVKDFLHSNRQLTDFILYYCGHGNIFDDERFYLLMRCSDSENEYFTVLKWGEFWSTIKETILEKRNFVILDCCFAGNAAREFMDVSPNVLLRDQTFAVLPSKGTVLVAAVERGWRAKSLITEPLTMFTGELVSRLSTGIPEYGSSLSFYQLVPFIRKSLLERHREKARLPIYNDVLQPQGPLAQLPLFINKASLNRGEHQQKIWSDCEKALSLLKSESISERLESLDVIIACMGEIDDTDRRSELLNRLMSFREIERSRAVIRRYNKFLENIDGNIGEKQSHQIRWLAIFASLVVALSLAYVSYQVKMRGASENRLAQFTEGRMSRAGYDRSRLNEVSEMCTAGCPENVVATVRERLGTLDGEKRQYAAAGTDVGRLAAYLHDCKACEFKDQAGQQLAGAATAQAGEAGYDRGRLNALAEACKPGCPENVVATVRERLGALDGEKRQYAAAGTDVGRLAAYLHDCKACEFEGMAGRRLTEAVNIKLDAAGSDRAKLNAILETCLHSCQDEIISNVRSRLQMIDEEKRQYDIARDDAGLLAGYISDCRICEFLKEAQRKKAQQLSEKSFRLYDNRDVVGSDIKSYGRFTIMQCQNSCKSEVKCVAYTYDKWNKVCLLKSEAHEIYLNPRSVSGLDRSVPLVHLSSSSIVMERFRGKSFSRSVAAQTVSARQTEECEVKCGSESLCVAYTYDKGEKLCKLYYSTSEYFPADNSDSGIKIGRP